MGSYQLRRRAAMLLMLVTLCVASGCATSALPHPGAGSDTAGSGTAASTHAPPPSTAQPAVTVYLTPATSGRTLTISLGRTLRVMAGAGWTIKVAPAPAQPVESARLTSLQLAATGPGGPGPGWVLLRAVRIGASVVTASAASVCGQATPNCGPQPERAVLTVEVHPVPGMGGGPLPLSDLALVSASPRS